MSPIDDGVRPRGAAIQPLRAVRRARLLSLLALILLVGCSFGRQASSLAALGGWDDRVARERARLGRLPTRDELVASFGGRPPRDGWGRDVVYLTWLSDERPHYALVSLGRDGKAECDSGPCYCELAPADVDDDVDRDQVICDGEFIRSAGK